MAKKSKQNVRKREKKMTQYDESVQRQRDMIDAEEWSSKIKSIHVHSFDSMHYDTRPEDTADGKSVTDHEFNSGIVQRYQNGKLIHTFGKELKGEELLRAFVRNH
jgi:hypothetical protein